MANRVGVTGSRYGHPWVSATLTNSHAVESIDQLILGDDSGRPKGAGVDREALLWAIKNSVFFVVWPAEWDVHDRQAGPIRNGHMVRYGKPDARFVGFPNGESSGTKNCLNQSRNAGLETYYVDIEGGVWPW